MLAVGFKREGPVDAGLIGLVAFAEVDEMPVGAAGGAVEVTPRLGPFSAGLLGEELGMRVAREAIAADHGLTQGCTQGFAASARGPSSEPDAPHVRRPFRARHSHVPPLQRNDEPVVGG